MVDIFQFNDFREYLRRFFEEKKQENRHYSFQLLAEKAGFNNRGFVYNIIKGSKKLSGSNCFKISKALGHNQREAEYFERLVYFAQAKNEEERTSLLEKIQTFRVAALTPSLLIEKEQYEYLSRWYHSAIRALIEMYPSGDDYDFFCRKIFPPVTIDQVKQSIELLMRLKIIRIDTRGKYRVTGKKLRASPEISRVAVNRFHVECTELAKQSVIYSPSKLHLVSSLTLGISEETYHAIRNETIRFKEKILDLAAGDDKADRVYQYQLALFPLTRENGTNGNEK